MKQILYFLNKTNHPVYIAVSASLIYLFVSLYILTEVTFPLYLSLISFLFLVGYIFYIKIQYKKELPEILKELDNQELKEFMESIYIKFKHINKEYINSFFSKISESKNVIHLRFSDSSLFKSRVDTLIFSSISSFTDNLEALNNIISIQDKSTVDYSSEIKEIENWNEDIIKNLDILIKELLLEKISKEKKDELNSDFSRTFNLFNKIKGN